MKTKLEVEAKFKIPLGTMDLVTKAIEEVEANTLAIEHVYTYHHYSTDGTRRTMCSEGDTYWYAVRGKTKGYFHKERFLINRKTLDPASGFDIEEEGSISKTEFLDSISPDDKCVFKLRKKITYIGKCYEFDHYGTPRLPYETLELELDDVDSFNIVMAYFKQFNTLPLFAQLGIKVPIEDVTFDLSYRNKNLAVSIP